MAHYMAHHSPRATVLLLLWAFLIAKYSAEPVEELQQAAGKVASPAENPKADQVKHIYSSTLGCARKMHKLVRMLCNGCVSYWNKDKFGVQSAADSYSVAASKGGKPRKFIDAIVKPKQDPNSADGALIAIDAETIVQPTVFDEVVQGCCQQRTCTYNMLTEYCCN